MTALLGAFRRHSLGVDVVYVVADVGPGANTQPPLNLSAYDIVVAPTLWVVPDTLASELSNYVAGGGCLLLTMRSGSKNAANQYTSSPLPGAVLGPLAGVVINEVRHCAVRLSVGGRSESA
jgi:beta-galactosidase GanA